MFFAKQLIDLRCRIDFAVCAGLHGWWQPQTSCWMSGCEIKLQFVELADLLIGKSFLIFQNNSTSFRTHASSTRIAAIRVLVRVWWALYCLCLTVVNSWKLFQTVIEIRNCCCDAQLKRHCKWWVGDGKDKVNSFRKNLMRDDKSVTNQVDNPIQWLSYVMMNLPLFASLNFISSSVYLTWNPNKNFPPAKWSRNSSEWFTK